MVCKIHGDCMQAQESGCALQRAEYLETLGFVRKFDGECILLHRGKDSETTGQGESKHRDYLCHWSSGSGREGPLADAVEEAGLHVVLCADWKPVTLLIQEFKSYWVWFINWQNLLLKSKSNMCNYLL